MVVIALVLYLFYALIVVKNFRNILSEGYHGNNFVSNNDGYGLHMFLVDIYIAALVQSSRVDLIFTRFENMCFKIIGTDLEHMSAKTYVKHFLAFNGFMGVITFVLLIVQQWLFF